MHLRKAAAAALAALGLVVTAQVPAQAGTPHYYLSLGDSLSRGYQPGLGDTDQGYPDALYAELRRTDPRLRLVKLGCSGESTTSMLNGGECTYRTGSQVGDARRFLYTHRAQVRYVTINVGSNDVGGCITGGSIDLACVQKGIDTIAGNLPKITRAIRTAAGHGPRLLGMNYYDPYLAAWLQGPEGQQLARQSVELLRQINGVETSAYQADGFKVADVAGAFASEDFGNPQTLPGVGEVPLNVFRVCTWTYMCSQGNIHANPTGYQQIAKAFLPLTGR